MSDHLPRLRRSLTALLGAAVVLAAPSAARAAAPVPTSCPVQPSAKVFSAFGDSANYFLAPGGSFEAGSASWQVRSGSVVAGNQDAAALPGGGKQSLALRAGGEAVSPAFCVDSAHPKFRLMVRRTSGMYGLLTVKLRLQRADGSSQDYIVSTTAGGATWAPTKPLVLSGLATSLAGPLANVRIVLTADTLGGATWAVDDVYLDPYAR